MNVIYKKYGKRIIDFILAFIALVTLSPILLILTICVRINLGSPIIFKQTRIGLNEKEFTMFKFRTMRNVVDSKGKLLPDEERVTKFGAMLRACGADELPELVNILRGDLAIVGPRPLISDYLPYYTEEERIRHTVRGGLTQPEVLYNKDMPSWDEQLSYEVEYAKNVTFMTDLKIIFKTVKIVFKRVNDNYGNTTRKSLSEERELNSKTNEVKKSDSRNPSA